MWFVCLQSQRRRRKRFCVPVAAAVCIFIFLVDTSGNEPCIVVVTEVIFLLVFAGKLLRKPEHSVTQLSPPRLFKVCLKNSDKFTETLAVGLLLWTVAMLLTVSVAPTVTPQRKLKVIFKNGVGLSLLVKGSLHQFYISKYIYRSWGEQMHICGEKNIKSLFWLERISHLQWCHSVAQLHCGKCRQQVLLGEQCTELVTVSFTKSRGITCVVPHVNLPFQTVVPTLPTVQLSYWVTSLEAVY